MNVAQSGSSEATRKLSVVAASSFSQSPVAQASSYASTAATAAAWSSFWAPLLPPPATLPNIPITIGISTAARITMPSMTTPSTTHRIHSFDFFPSVAEMNAPDGAEPPGNPPG